MKTNTKYFGTIDYEPGNVLHFPKGLFGFEQEHEFLLLPFSGNGTLFCLQSLATPQLAFVMMDPFSLTPDYAPVLQPDELHFLNVEHSEDLNYYVMCVVREPISTTTVNLRCPVSISDERTGIQVILEDTTYHMRHQLAEFAQDEEEDSDDEEVSAESGSAAQNIESGSVAQNVPAESGHSAQNAPGESGTDKEGALC